MECITCNLENCLPGYEGLKKEANPYKLNPMCPRLIWIKCVENPKHGSYLIKCRDFTMGKRCPKCKANK